MSTDDADTDTDAGDLAEAFPRVAKLEQELKEADIDVGDIPQRKGTTRRDLLAGSAGLLGLGGVLTSASGTASAGDDQAGTVGSQAAPLDGYVEDLYDKNGNRVAELPGDGSLDVLQELSSQSVNTDEIISSHRQGDTVYYDPTARGPYIDLQDAIADVPAGGLLRLAGETFDPSTEGRLVVDGFNVRGVPGDIQDGYGTIFENVGAQAVTTGPIVDIDGGATDQRKNMHVEGVTVENDAAVTQVRVKDAPLTKLQSVKTDADPDAQSDKGIYVTGNSYSTRLLNCGGFAANGPGIHIDGAGSDYVLMGTGCQSRSGWGAIYDALGVRVYGGQHAGDTGGAKVLGDGIVLDGFNAESTPIGVQFGDSTAGVTANDSVVRDGYFASIGDSLCRWEDSTGCAFVDPRRMINPSNSSTAYVANADAAAPYVEGRKKAFKYGADFSAAADPSGNISQPRTFSTAERDGMIDLSGMTVYNAGDSTWYRNDGTGWSAF